MNMYDCLRNNKKCVDFSVCKLSVRRKCYYKCKKPAFAKNIFRLRFNTNSWRAVYTFNINKPPTLCCCNSLHQGCKQVLYIKCIKTWLLRVICCCFLLNWPPLSANRKNPLSLTYTQMLMSCPVFAVTAKVVRSFW